MTDAADIKRVQIRTRATTAREYDVIAVDIGGLHLACDLIEGFRGDTQIRQAAAMARECGLELEVTDQRLITRVQGSLAYKPDPPR